MTPDICMIITAAGVSRRNPGKLVYKLGTQTVIRQCVSQYVEFPCDIVVVTGHEREKIECQLEQIREKNIHFAYNPDFRAGLASSLIAGIASVSDNYAYYGFSNGDKPFIKPGTIRKLMDYLHVRNPLILFPKCNSEIGHPSFFHRSLRTSLLTLDGDEGGRQLIPAHKNETVYLDVEDEGVLLDMDRYFKNQTPYDPRAGKHGAAS